MQVNANQKEFRMLKNSLKRFATLLVNKCFLINLKLLSAPMYVFVFAVYVIYSPVCVLMQTTIRFIFPEKLVVQAQFHRFESVAALFAFARGLLVNSRVRSSAGREPLGNTDEGSVLLNQFHFFLPPSQNLYVWLCIRLCIQCSEYIL